MSTRSATIFNGTIDPNELNNPKFPWYTANGTAGHYDGLNTLNATLAPFSNVPFDTHYGWSRLILPEFSSAGAHPLLAKFRPTPFPRPKSTEGVKAAKKTAKAAAPAYGEKKKRKKVRKGTYSSFIYNVSSSDIYTLSVDQPGGNREVEDPYYLQSKTAVAREFVDGPTRWLSDYECPTPLPSN
ncbi:hypothetical protein K443DRAFT_14836 [Laccaria amethystina LaAM-08-1]|uniref:Uncharacterized protein n=1 Tax=Laccaria amethystina LaAM-08-1 TaxID=1095629 RepID=A0A0C9WHB7_9AGAR|nr:hypothetical protein K443DRAFT_14836 [Laccaria amethystina LaAM-08-1]